MVSVDTNVLVRILTIENRAQVERAEAFISRGAWVSLIVLVETIWVLAAAYGRSKEQVATAVELLLSHETLVLDQPETVRAALETFRANTNVSFSDCLIVEAGRRSGHLPLGTFDSGLSRIQGTLKL